MYVTLNALDQCLPSLQAPELRYVNVFFMYNTEQLSSKLGLIDQETWTDMIFIVGKLAISFGKKCHSFSGLIVLWLVIFLWFFSWLISTYEFDRTPVYDRVRIRHTHSGRILVDSNNLLKRKIQPKLVS